MVGLIFSFVHPLRLFQAFLQITFRGFGKLPSEAERILNTMLGDVPKTLHSHFFSTFTTLVMIKID
ncbi:MAG: hypothetical protein ACT6FG_05540, partial [Methanosarcinaceae archaeon]